MSAGPGTALAAAVMARLSQAGLGEGAIPGWWRAPRQELGGLAPEDALAFDQGRVLALAEEDAAAFCSDFGEAR